MVFLVVKYLKSPMGRQFTKFIESCHTRISADKLLKPLSESNLEGQGVIC